MKPDLILWTTNPWSNLVTEDIYNQIIECKDYYKEVMDLIKFVQTTEFNMTPRVAEYLEKWATKRLDMTRAGRVNWSELAGYFIQSYFERY